MKREFLINLIFLLGINVLVKPLYLFGIDRNVQNLLAPGEYGVYAQILSLTYLLQMIADFGLQNYNNRQIAQHRFLVGKYFPALVSAKILLSFLFASLVIGTSILLGYWQRFPDLVILLALNQILLSFLLFLRSNVSGLGYYRWDSFLSILDKLLMILLLGTVFWLGYQKEHFQLSWFVWAQTISFLTPITLAIILLRKDLTRFRLRFNWPLITVIIKQSYPYALVVLLMTLYTRIDMIMLGKLLKNGDVEADLYASAYRLLDAANMFGYLFATLLLPMFARLLKQQGMVGALVRTGIQLIWAGAIPLTAALFFYQDVVMEALYVDGSAYSGRILAWLMLSFIAVTGSYIYGTLLTANGSLMAMNRIFLIGVIANILLNWWLIPNYQSIGAAMATCVTQFFAFSAQVILSLRKVSLKTDIRLILRILGFSLLVGCSGWILKYYSPMHWVYSFIGVLTSGIIWAIITRMLPLQESLQIFKSRNKFDQ